MANIETEQWTNICVSWAILDGEIKFFRDGVQNPKSENVGQKDSIKRGGTLTLFQVDNIR